MNILNLPPKEAARLATELNNKLLSEDREYTPEERLISKALYALGTIPGVLKEIKELKDFKYLKESILFLQYERVSRFTDSLFEGQAALENYLKSINYSIPNDSDH